MRKLLETLDRIPPFILLAANCAIALLIAVAHGAALLVSHLQPSANGQFIQRVATISLPSAAFVLLSAAAVLFRRQLLLRVLALHAVILFVGAIALYVWAVSLLFYGVPRRNFTWGVGWLTAFCVYPTYLLRRTLLDRARSRHWWIMYAHVIILALVLPVDVGVFIRAVVTLNRRPNQALQPTPSRLISSLFMTKILPEAASHALARRG
jgi:hypothetical protein